MDRRKRLKVFQVIAATIAVFVVIAMAIQAFRQDSWAPLWQLGWLPAVLVASFSGSVRAGRCRPRSHS